MDRTFNLRWYYNKRHDDKEPMDGVGGIIKNRVYRDVMPNKCVIKSAEEFASKVVIGITPLYLPEVDLLTEPDDIEEAPKIPEILSIHVQRRFAQSDFSVWLLTLNHSSHSFVEWIVTPKFVVMNYYHYRSTSIKPLLFAKAIARVKLNGFSATSVNRGSTNVVSLNNLMLDI